MVSWKNKVKVSKVENIKKSNKWAKEKIKSLKIKPAEKNSKRGNIFKNGFTKLKEKLNPIKTRKNKIIGSKKLAFLLTSGTIIAILPIAPLPAYFCLCFQYQFYSCEDVKESYQTTQGKI
ncbi:hypothetical protein wCauA_01510 [Wolbachia endosymbiont of Carposina sasakii]|nr:hypothetical protein [Wolbachia endosymbiont of Carposina sasakii]QDH18365.1 hypothetical protein wCauA_01510 [Wolbachia endosymbiont of Carposina sasakii]